MADTMIIRHLATGREAEGPLGAVPEGFERVSDTRGATTPAMDDILAGLADTLGFRPDPESYLPGKRTSLDVLTQPEGLLERAAQMAVTAPAIALGGTAAGAAGAAKALPVLGRIATSGLISGAQSAARGDEAGQIALNTGLGAAAGTLGEGAGAAVRGAKIPLPGGKTIPVGTKAIADPLENARSGYAYYTEQLRNAIPPSVKARLIKTPFLDVPEIAKGARLTVDDALAGLERLDGRSYWLGLRQIATQLNQAERDLSARLVGQGAKAIPRPNAGTVLLHNAPKERFVYGGTPAQRFASVADSIVNHPLTRGTLDALSLTPAYGLPVGVVGAKALADNTGATRFGARMIGR